MPTSARDTYTVQKLTPAFHPEDAEMVPVSLVDGTYAAGTVLGQVTASGKFKAYATGNADGSETARGLLVYGCTVASGVISGIDEFAAPKDTPMYIAGYFRTEDLTGLDAAGVEDLNGALPVGTVSTGLLKF